MDYGQEVCDFAIIILFPLHFIYIGNIAFTAAIVLTVNYFACDLVMDFCEEIEFALTQSNLISFNSEKDSVKKLRIVGFIFMRAQKPFKLTIGTFGELNLRLFARTAHSIFSFICLLRVVYNV